MLIYLGVLAGAIGVSVVAFWSFQLHPLPTVLFLLGVVYLFAGMGWPRGLYLTLRSMRQFARYSDPTALRRRMLMIGVILIVGALCITYFWFYPESWPWAL